ncbi:hypothetical protein [[Mycoplasma] mobile]|uniref:Expressed protein n=1 Tax=Mycoplasma mobile (strain ATCC 43663 / 163K / NCTC 11711) TaxID=267748 RepID=Q6KH41_MYCM1|nr:hypothetical protein [[Mycoplasma] mobile]AAT28090.1 expressed protein [Mycoplasma mobile 163K]
MAKEINLKLKEDEQKILESFNQKLAENFKKRNLLKNGNGPVNKNTNVTTVDYYTFLNHPSTAINLINQSSSEITYFYTDDGINKWYPHSIDSKNELWDWQWSNFDTRNAMVVQLPINKTQTKFIVIPLSKYYAPEGGETPLTNIYSQIVTKDTMPSFNNGKWTWENKDLFPSSVDNSFTFHARLYLRDNGDFEWVGAF